MMRPLRGLDSRKSFIENTCGAYGGVHPESCVPKRKRVVSARGVADCILEIVDQEKICAMDVARWDTLFGTATRPK